MRVVTVSAFMVMTCVGSALAGPTVTKSEYDQCIERSDGTNAAWAACGSAVVQREDAALNAAWMQIYPDLEAASKAALLDEQRAWIVYRDKACGLYQSGDRGREGQVLGYPTCVAEVIKARREQLLSYGDENHR